MDPINSVNYQKDSSLAMLWAASARDWELTYLEQEGLFIEGGKAYALARKLDVFEDPKCWYNLSEAEVIPLESLDIILMRKDPPFDMRFVYTTYILDYAQNAGVLIVNRPESLRNCNEKIFATHFPQCCTPTLVSGDKAQIKRFAKKHKDIILKPLDGMGGSSIFRTGATDNNLSVIIEVLTEHGKTPVMAQQFIPEISSGDKRILLINGQPMSHCLARIPAKGETRGNLAAGGTGEVRPLTERDRWICEQVGNSLRKYGLIFVGLDIIGDYLTEINVTSPTCIREIDREANLNIAGRLMDEIERTLDLNN